MHSHLLTCFGVNVTRLLVLLAVFIINAPFCISEQPPPLAEKYLHSGKLAEGETALLLALESNPMDDEVRFGLGVIQLMRAVENLGKSLYEYGASSTDSSIPFPQLPLPNNESPSSITYFEYCRVLDSFANDLRRAEATLAEIEGDSFKVPIIFQISPWISLAMEAIVPTFSTCSPLSMEGGLSSKKRRATFWFTLTVETRHGFGLNVTCFPRLLSSFELWTLKGSFSKE